MREIKMQDLLESIELASDYGTYYYSKITGKTVYITEDDRMLAEDLSEDDLEHYPKWQRDIIETAIEIEYNWDNYIPLPTKFDINEYNIMVKFCYSLDDEVKFNKVLYALNGKGAFKKFKNAVRELNIEKAWYEFKDKAFMEIALEWCDENDIKIKDEA